MDSPKKLAENCPPGSPLNQISPERANQQKQWDLPTSPTATEKGSKSSKHSRDSSVNEKIAQFNSLAYQGKQLERKANDAALKRAMVGREEAESEMRRYRDEARILRRQVEEGKERERKVGERLESVMVCYRFAHQSDHPLTPHLIRKIMVEPRKHIHIHKHYGKRKFEELGKKASNHNRSLSNYKKNSNLQGIH